MSVDVQQPTDRSVRPQITWLNNQLKWCFKKNSNANEHLKSNLMVDINIKFTRKPVRVMLEELDTAYEKLKGKEIKSFSVVYVNYLGKKFESRKMFVIAIDEMLVSYYEDIVQYLKNWKKPAPKVKPLEDEI